MSNLHGPDGRKLPGDHRPQYTAKELIGKIESGELGGGVVYEGEAAKKHAADLERRQAAWRGVAQQLDKWAGVFRDNAQKGNDDFGAVVSNVDTAKSLMLAAAFIRFHTKCDGEPQPPSDTSAMPPEHFQDGNPTPDADNQ